MINMILADTGLVTLYLSCPLLFQVQKTQRFPVAMVPGLFTAGKMLLPSTISKKNYLFLFLRRTIYLSNSIIQQSSLLIHELNDFHILCTIWQNAGANIYERVEKDCKFTADSHVPPCAPSSRPAGPAAPLIIIRLSRTSLNFYPAESRPRQLGEGQWMFPLESLMIIVRTGIPWNTGYWSTALQ